MNDVAAYDYAMKRIPLKQFATANGLEVRTLQNWCKQGRVKGAIRKTGLHGDYWMIPEDAAVDRPKRGFPEGKRKRKKGESDNERKQ